MSRLDAQPACRTRILARGAALRAVALLAVVVLCGCAPNATDGTGGRRGATGDQRTAAPALLTQPSSDDPCAARLHDICGVLLLHVLTQGELPATLEALGPGPGGGDLPPLLCPASNRPYQYNPYGIYMPEQKARLVMYDPEPSHGGMRWGIIAIEATETDPLVCKVVVLPETFFVLRPPR